MATGSLQQALDPMGATKLESLGGIVLTSAMFGRNLLHLHRPTSDDDDSDLNGGFWVRHRQLEQILLQTSLHLPDHLRMPSGRDDPNVVFMNMCIQTSAICLHQASIFKADKYQLPVSVGNESKIRCVTAAAEIASIMRTISHMDLSAVRLHTRHMYDQDLTYSDESLHILLCLCSSKSVCSVPQNTTRRSADGLFTTVSPAGNAGLASQESADRIIPGSTRP